MNKRWIDPIIALPRVRSGLKGYLRFRQEWRAYSKMAEAEKLSIHDAYPCLHDTTPSTPFDAHYFYQDIWAFKAILRSGAAAHVDVGSLVTFVGMLTAITKVTFVDIRPLTADLDNLEVTKGSILSLPFEDNSVSSLSCLHVAEHIGLGRYGDPIDPAGTKKATRELTKILAPGGTLYFSLPVGRPRVCFNAHRIHSPRQILDYFSDLTLIEFSAITDDGAFIQNIEYARLEDSYYSCGLFRFMKKGGS